MVKRLAFLATAATLIASFATNAVASGRGYRHREGAARARLAPDTPDQVLQWNKELQKVLVAPGAQPASIHPTRTLAITQISVYDAVNGILGGGEPLVVYRHAPRHASAEAAAAAAARTTLDALLPSQQATVDGFFESSLAQLGSSGRVDRGIRFGTLVAEAVLAARANDGATATPPVFTPAAGPDVLLGGEGEDVSPDMLGWYQLTPPAFAPAGFTETAHVTPFVLLSASQFRPAPPPAPTSAEYAADFNEVKSLGELNSTTRTADQTAIGKFWGAAPIWIVWNQIADQAAVGLGNSLEQNARLFAQLDTTLADSAIALYDAKYAYHRWRPITAITATDLENPNTVADPNWVPLANTANDPSYPGAHATFSQAAATVLRDFFATNVFSFSLTDPSIGITRSFTSFSAAAHEASESQIFAGQHFRYDQQAGQTLGRRVADFVVHHAVLPITIGRR